MRLSLLALVVCPWPIRAVTCARDTVPAATLLVPYFRVSRNGADGAAPIPAQGSNTVMAITNTGTTGVITHFTVFNKYGKAVFGFNVPLDAWDVAFFDMRQILNGDLNLNPNAQSTKKPDVCSTGAVGFGPTRFRRFDNPDPEDRVRAVSVYPPLGGEFLIGVRDSLDESGDVTSFRTAKWANLLDRDNPACDSLTASPTPDGRLSGDFSGYLTIDVVNYCTNHGPAEPDSLYYVNDALATTGWSGVVAGISVDTPNVLMGDVFYVDPAASGGNVSGDPMVAMEFDPRLAEAGCSWANDSGTYTTGCRTFYSRYFVQPGARKDPGSTPSSVPEAYRGTGDGREPLTSRYGFRYLSNPAVGLESWATVWRTDLWEASRLDSPHSTNLCEWWADCLSDDINRCRGWGSWSAEHRPSIRIFNNDGVLYTFELTCCEGATLPPPAFFLETQRIALAGNADIGLNDPAFRGGWIDVGFPGLPATGQAWVGVQHSAPGQLISVGHAATVLSKPIECVPALFTPPAESATR